MPIYPKTNGEVVLDQAGAKGIRLMAEQGCELVELTLEKGAVIPAHTLPFPVTFYVVQGVGDAVVSQQKIYAQTGDVLTVEAYAERTWSTQATEGVRLLVIKHIG